LHPKRTHEMRVELQYMKQQQSSFKNRMIPWRQGPNSGESFESDNDQHIRGTAGSSSKMIGRGTHKRYQRRDDGTRNQFFSV